MSRHRLDGTPRGKRKYSDYKNSPLPTIEDKLMFILHYLKSNNLQTVQGALFGMSQPKANLWIHGLHPILNQTLAEVGERPARQMADVSFDEDERHSISTTAPSGRSSVRSIQTSSAPIIVV